MSVISAAAMQTMTDQIAGKIQAALNGYANESSAKTLPWLADQLAANAGSDANAALAAGFLATDRFGYPENYEAQLASLFGRSGSDMVNNAQGLSQYVRSALGGGYASYSAYVKDKTPTLDPLFGELMRQKGGDALVDPAAASTPIGVFAPAYQVTAADSVFAGADGALADITTAAGNATTADMTLFASNNHFVYIRCRQPFTRAIFGLSTLANTSISPTFEYWNGTAWTTLPGLVDNSGGLTKNDTIQWTLPADWEPSYKDGTGAAFATAERLYTVRVKRTQATVATPPVGTCLTVVTVPRVASGTKAYHLPVGQPALALLRITATNAIAVDWIVDPDTTRYVPPAFRFKALSAFGASLTLTAAYKNQAGVAVTQAQSAWSSPAALATVAATLNGSDTGLKNLLTTGWAVVVSSSGLGVIAVEVARLRTPAV